MEQLTPKSVTVATPARCRPPRANAAANQQGMVLFIALIVLVAMTLAGIALVRSVDTANVIAGNLAFKQATLQAADLGVEAAVTALPTIIAGSVDTNLTPAASSTNPNYWYYATRRETDAYAVPTQKQYGAAGAATAINWTQVPVAQTLSGNSVQIVIDRLCRGPTPVTDLMGQCFADPPATGGDSDKFGSSFSGTPIVYYRLTARVAGPRNTVSMVQAILSR
jgi:Tfp pilus assembly protein PilX